MSLSYVTLTGTLGAVATGAIAVFTPAGWLPDPTDQLLIPPASQRVTLLANGTIPANTELLATDNVNTPTGWTWMVTISGIPTVPEYSFSFQLPYANGATQDISALAQTPAVTPTQAYLPLPSGTPSSGQVPVATGVGEGSAWGSGGGGGGAVSSVFGRTGTVAATSGDYTVSEVTGAAPLASPALTGTPTAPTATALTDSTQLATTAYADSAVAVETSRAETAEALKLAKASNLSDVASASTARANLGLGTAATQSSSAFDAAGAAATAQSNAEAASLPIAGGTLTGWLAPAVVTLTFVGSGTTTINAASGNVFALTLTASTTTLGSPSNPVDGQAIRVRVIQGSGGGFTLAYNTVYDFGAAGAPVLSTAAAKVDILGFEYVASLAKWCYLGSGLGF